MLGQIGVIISAPMPWCKNMDRLDPNCVGAAAVPDAPGTQTAGSRASGNRLCAVVSWRQPCGASEILVSGLPSVWQ